MHVNCMAPLRDYSCKWAFGPFAWSHRLPEKEIYIDVDEIHAFYTS